MIPQLVLSRDGRRDRLVEVTPPSGGRAGTVRIERDPDSDVVVTEVWVRPHHCQIARVDWEFWLGDLNSREGTISNGRRVLGRHRPVAACLPTGVGSGERGRP